MTEIVQSGEPTTTLQNTPTPVSPVITRRGRKVVKFLHEMRGRSRVTGAQVGMYATEHADNDGAHGVPQFLTGPGRTWAIFCHTHGEIGYARTSEDGYKALTSPQSFCSQCKAIADGQMEKPVKVNVTPASEIKPTRLIMFSLPGQVFEAVGDLLPKSSKIEEKKVGVNVTHIIETTEAAGRRVAKNLGETLKTLTSGADRNKHRAFKKAMERVEAALGGSPEPA